MKGTMKRQLFLVALVSLGAFGGSWVKSNITVAMSPSIDKRVFWKGDGHPSASNQFGTFVYPNHPYLEKREMSGKPFTKRVGCIAGDRLEKIGQSFYCNGEFIAKALLHDRLDDTLPVFEFNGVVPDGKVFMVGDHPFSGDSRYLGFVELESVKRVIPIW